MNRKGNTRKLTAGKVAAGIVGVALVTGYFLTGSAGASTQDQKIYQKALDRQTEVDKIGFQEFTLADYPVSMYDGESDYVFYKGEITKREPVLETFAGTVYPVEDHFEVIIPTMERMESVLSLVGGVEGMVTGSGYGQEEQIATIWHEAFHAWQLSNFQILGKSITAKEMDQKEVRKNQFKNEMKGWKKLVLSSDMSAGNIDEIKEAVLEYRELADARRSQMSEQAIAAELQSELTEGTAYYVESNVLRQQKGDREYQTRYIDTLGTYMSGRGSLYRTGMAKCLILDVLAPDWKEQLDFTKSLDELLDEAVK
ncbi:MAG: hypothetical protein PHQ72_02745 [Hespellia sp.]|nr:hypothetical protein [Hespellia sp.]